MKTKILLVLKQYKWASCAVVFLLLHSGSVLSQNSLTISYGEKLDLGMVDAGTQFHITGAIDKHLKGNAINEFVFTNPGDYTVKVVEKKKKHTDDCHHTHLPNEIHLKVSRVRMSFNDDISFSRPIVKNTETAGIHLNVTVSVQTFDHLPVKINQSPIKVAGIGSAITAYPNAAKMELSEGQHTIEYTLNGIVAENSFLMFDFIDANDKIQSISLLTPVKN